MGHEPKSMMSKSLCFGHTYIHLDSPPYDLCVIYGCHIPDLQETLLMNVIRAAIVFYYITYLAKQASRQGWIKDTYKFKDIQIEQL